MAEGCYSSIEKKLRWYLLSIFAIAFVVLTIPALAAATTTFTDAKSYTGSDIYYTVTINTPGSMTINGRASGENPYAFDIAILDSSKREITTSYHTQEGSEYVNKGIFYLNTGKYLLQVNPGSPYSRFNYSLTLTLSSVGESFPEPYGGNNNTFSTASSIKLNTTYTGLFPSGTDASPNGTLIDAYDIYKFTIPASSGKTTIKTKSAAMVTQGDPCDTLNAVLYNSSGKAISSEYLRFNDKSYYADTWTLSLAPGTYYLSYEAKWSLGCRF